MTDKRDLSKAPRTGRQFPPTAAEVAECPPHRWLIEGKWQECRKCGSRMEVPQPQPASAQRAQARREAPAGEAEAVVPDAEAVDAPDLAVDAPDLDVVDEASAEVDVVDADGEAEPAEPEPSTQAED